MNCTDMHSKGCCPDSEEHLNVCLQMKRILKCFPEPRPGSPTEQFGSVEDLAPSMDSQWDDGTEPLPWHESFSVLTFMWILLCEMQKEGILP